MGLKRLMLAAGMILSAAFAFADNGTEFGVEDDLTVWGTQGSTADADVEIKGFTVFGSTTADNLAVYSGTGSVFMGGALEVSSNTYLRGSVVVGSTTSQGIFAVKDNFVVTSGGNVGIGTTSPSQQLTTTGHVRIGSDIYPALYLGSAGTWIGTLNNAETTWPNWDTSLVISAPNCIGCNRPIVFQRGTEGSGDVRGEGTVLMYINGQNGNVGIGTTNPGSKLHINSTDAVIIPVGTTSQRPSSPIIGMLRFNSDFSRLEYYDGSQWQPPPFSATGGTISNSGNYTIHTFTTSGTFTPTRSGFVDVLCVGGGGQGGSWFGGGGGGGGVLYITSFSVTAQTYAITVGDAGSGGTANQKGGDGKPSSFSTITAYGGGGGGGQNQQSGDTGGSGGGGSKTTGGSGTSGQGNAGGNATGSLAGGGGGGTGATGGGTSSGSFGGGGGNGLAYSISGASVYYGGGGGGCSDTSYSASGGLGGGGNGSNAGTAGTANTGGGGGGMDGNNAGKNGGSGIVIIRYLQSQ